MMPVKRKVRRIHRLNLAGSRRAGNEAIERIGIEPEASSIDSDVLRFRALAVGDQVLLRSPWSPTVWRGHVRWRDRNTVNIFWDGGHWGSFEVGRTYGWQWLERVEGIR